MTDSLENKAVNPQALKKAVDKINTDYLQDYPKLGSEQGFIASPTTSQNTTLTDPTKIDSSEKSKYTLLLPVASLHSTLSGRHATHEVNGKQEHFNENHIPSIGLAVKTSENTEVFATYINKNSLNDQMVLAGVQYVPFKTNIKGVTLGAGGAAGLAWTNHGSYAKEAPQLSVGNVSAIASALFTAELDKTGTGLQFNVVPTSKYLVAALTLRQRF